MADWPYSGSPIGPLVSLSIYHATGIFAAIGRGGAAGSATWPVANSAYFYPIRLWRSVVVVKAAWFNGATISGNVDAGLYSADGTRIVSTGSTAQAGASALQEADIADTRLGPGLFYLALAMDNVTGTMFRPGGAQSPSTEEFRCLGVFQQATAFPLPTTFTAATLTSAHAPIFGFSTRVVV